MSLELITDNTWQLGIFLSCVFLTGIVRGCIGFGFSILMIAIASLFLNPVLLVPTIVMLEVIASIHMLPSVWKEALWKEMLWILLGLFVGVPIGVYVLTVAPENVLRLSAAFLIFALTLFVLKGTSFRGTLTISAFVLIGVIAGFLSGIAASGGIVVATCLSLASLPIKQVRATLVVYLFITSFIFIGCVLVVGSLELKVFHTVAIAMIPMTLGIMIGTKLFHFLDESKLRKLILTCLCILSIIGMVKAFLTFI